MAGRNQPRFYLKHVIQTIVGNSMARPQPLAKHLERSLQIVNELGIVTTTAAPAVNRIRCYNQCFRLIFWLFCN